MLPEILNQEMAYSFLKSIITILGDADIKIVLIYKAKTLTFKNTF